MYESEGKFKKQLCAIDLAYLCINFWGSDKFLLLDSYYDSLNLDNFIDHNVMMI